MAQGNGIITELRLEPGGISARIQCPSGLHPTPGQYLTASSPDANDPLPITLFPSRVEGGDIWAGPPLPPTWTAGAQLNLRGPLGKGFKLPPTARRVALASLEGTPEHLLSLAHQALRQQAAVTVYSSSSLNQLPAEVEILPLDLLPEAPAWADFLAVECAIQQLANLSAQLGLRPHQQPACQTQVLVLAEMPCGGLAECGICAVSTRDGWAYACSDGPVFDYRQLAEG